MSEYVPFGDEWKKHVAKLPKRELVEMLAKALREKQEIQVELFREQQSRPTKRALDLRPCGHKWESIVMNATTGELYCAECAGASQ